MSTAESARPRAGARATQRRRPPQMTPALLGLMLVAAVLAAFAVAAWTGVLPYGSDADEYPLVARALLDDGRPIVAEVEGTKYPLGYPLVLAVLFAMGLPPMAGLVLNVVLVVATVAMVVAALRDTHGGFARLAAAVFVAVNVGLWGSVSLLMPDTLVTFLAAVLLYVIVRMERVRDVVVVSVLSFAATTVKTLGLFIAGAASFALLFGDRGLRKWFLLPGAAGLLAVALHTLVLRGYPQPATGYATQFWSVNPYDAAAGRASVGDVVSRLWTRWDVVLGDWGAAVVGPHVPATLAMVLAVILLAAGIWGLGRRWAYGVGLVVLYGAGLALWPFTSIRFGLPMIPLATVGVAQLAAQTVALQRPVWRQAGIAVIVVALAVQAVVGISQVEAAAEEEAAVSTSLHSETALAAHWAEHNIPAGDQIASPAYRELYARFERRILPVSYTRDPDELWAQTGGRGAEWLVNLTQLYPRRVRLSRVLVNAYPDRFSKVFENDEVVIYRINAPE